MRCCASERGWGTGAATCGPIGRQRAGSLHSADGLPVEPGGGIYGQEDFGAAPQAVQRDKLAVSITMEFLRAGSIQYGKSLIRSA